MEKGLKRFTGKSVLVTGAGSGIGRGISLRLAQEGGDIAVCDIDEEKAKETVVKIEALEQRVVVLVCDVAKEKEIKQAVEIALKTFGKIDILVNCAGTCDTNMSFEDIDSQLWDRIYSVNVKGPFFLSKVVARDMIKKKIKGKIINISSTGGEDQSSRKHSLFLFKTCLDRSYPGTCDSTGTSWDNCQHHLSRID